MCRGPPHYAHITIGYAHIHLGMCIYLFIHLSMHIYLWVHSHSCAGPMDLLGCLNVCENVLGHQGINTASSGRNRGSDYGESVKVTDKIEW